MITSVQQQALDDIGLTNDVIQYARNNETQACRVLIQAYALYYAHPDDAAKGVLQGAIADCQREISQNAKTDGGAHGRISL